METEQSNNNKSVQIRSPSMNEYLTFSFDSDTTILSLKLLIQESHPQKPTPEDQRIIYGGKVQPDTDHLEVILEKASSDSIPVFHLVVKPSLNSTTQSKNNTNTSMETGSSTSSIPQEQEQEQTNNPLFSNTVPLTNNDNNNNNNNNSNTFIPTLSTTPLTHGGYQVLSINGQYYLAPILVPNNNINNDITNLSSSISENDIQRIVNMINPSNASITTGTTSSTNINRQQQPQQQQQQPINVNNTNNNNNNNNVNQRIIGRQRAMPRNASIWLALKLIFVLLVTCQGASIERVVIFHIMAIVFFMYQTGRFRVVIRRGTLEDLQNQLPPGFNLPREFQQQTQQRAQQQQQQQQDQNQNQSPPTYTQATSSTDVNNDNNDNNNNNNDNNDNTNEIHRDNSIPNQEQTTPLNNNDNHNTPNTANSNTQEQSQSNDHNTRLSVVKRGAYTFVASLWPNYGRDPQLAQAFENEDNEMAEL